MRKFSFYRKLGVLLMALSVLTACGDTDENDKDDKPNNAPANEENKSPDMNGPDEDDPHLNDSGEPKEDQIDTDKKSYDGRNNPSNNKDQSDDRMENDTNQ
ncbi:hypothetical protein GCM10028778_07640 [Barrientosiimonas marina]|uniref:Lipoprotein n=1 Tax=Lentibacillus kimchii TaxID=1542911 RepID=A0ABW2UZY9_9BACI